MFELEAEESTVIKFYKKDISQNYSYANGSGGTPIVQVNDRS